MSEGTNGELLQLARSIANIRKAKREEMATLKDEYSAKLDEMKTWYTTRKQEIRDEAADRALEELLGGEEDNGD